MRTYWPVSLVFLLVLASAVHGAVIHGSVYDAELNTLSQAIIELNTEPQQVMVSRNGTYQFSVSPGSYVISAHHTKLDIDAREQITVKGEGTYVLDLILFPDLETEEDLLNDTLDVPDYDEPETAMPVTGFIVLAVLMLIGIALWYGMRRKHEAKKEPSAKADLGEILAFVRKEGGRTTQKELRKAIPYSEAKISLMIAELESQGKLKKIKKGRGNIIMVP